MKYSKRFFLFTLTVFFVLIMSSCSQYEYQGKEISTIWYSVVDYHGDYTTETIVDLENCQVLNRGYLPHALDIPEFETIYTFEDESIAIFLNEVGKAKLFEIDNSYLSSEEIDDGSGWTLTINYKDGTKKVSNGDNNRPSRIFGKADYAFYNLYGDDLFDTLPTSYKSPPTIDIDFKYSIGNDSFSQIYSGVSPINFTWNKSKLENVDVIEYVKEHPLHEFNPLYAYKLVLWTANYEYQFNNLNLRSFDMYGDDEKLIDNKYWFSQNEYNLEFNRIYVITISFDDGTCEYAFSTITD